MTHHNTVPGLLLFLLLSIGCSGVVVPPAPEDAQCRDLSDAGVVPDAGPDHRITAIGACGWIGGIFGRKFLEGNLADCTQAACPFVYDRTGRVEVRCDTAEVEACVRELEGGANDCATYDLAIARCTEAATTCDDLAP
jgi:hypothetical protein